MLDLKPYGAFIEHTVRPLFEESELLLKQLEKAGLSLNDIQPIFKRIGQLHFAALIIEAVKTIICTAIIGYVAWTISRS